MLIVGEKINTSRKVINKAVKERNSDLILEEVKKQIVAGADYLDINCGTLYSEEEPDVLEWLVKIIQDTTSAQLCIDSPNIEALSQALSICKGTPIVNSISGEALRYEKVLPLVKQYNARVIVLNMDDNGIPKSLDQAMEVGIKLINDITNDGVPLQDIYLDPLVQTLAANQACVNNCLELIKELGEIFPGLHFISGISNVSYGLPERRHLNRALVVMSILNGLDAVIMDPLDKIMSALIFAAEALTNRDNFCLKYINAFQNGKLSK